MALDTACRALPAASNRHEDKKWTSRLIERIPARRSKIAAIVAVMNEALREAIVTGYDSLVPVEDDAAVVDLAAAC